MNFKLILTNKLTSELCIYSSAIISIILFYLYSLVYAILAFVQFSWFEIVSVSVIFLLLLCLLHWIFLRQSLYQYKRKKLKINIKIFCLSLFQLLFMFALSNTVEGDWGHYIRSFPLTELDAGLGWHHDSAFHVALIQSIINFGFPSIAQHGNPLSQYHVLSHYVDALILIFTGLDAFDSYGILFHFKIFLVLSCSLLLIEAISREYGIYTFIISILILMPCIIGSWHLIGSHGLWMASVILLTSTPYVLDRILNEKKTLNIYLFNFFIIIVLIALAKISSGFMYAVLIGFLILAKQPYRPSTYIFGIFILLFFFGYSKLFINAEDLVLANTNGIDFSINDTLSFLKSNASNQLAGVLSCFLIILIFTIFIRNKIFYESTFAIFASIICLIFISSNLKFLAPNDVSYFIYGLSSIALLLTYFLILKSTDYNFIIKNIIKIPLGFYCVYLVVFIIAIALLSKSFHLPSVNIFNINPKTIYKNIIRANTKAFNQINKKLPLDMQVTLLSSIQEKKAAIRFLNNNGVFRNFKNVINYQISLSESNKSNTAVAISKEIFESHIANFGGILWAQGLLTYAITGVPLLYAVKDFRKGYGFDQYKEIGKQKNTSSLLESDVCDVKKYKFVQIYLYSLSNPVVIECK